MFDINKPNRVQVRVNFVSQMTHSNCVNTLNLPHALATVFDSNLLELSEVNTIKVEKIVEISNEQVDAF